MKQKNVFYSSLCVILFIIVISGPGFLQGAGETLPKAEKILDRYIEVTGGKAAYDKIQNRVTKATVEMTGAGINLSMTNWQAKPNKSYSVLESDATGKVESGSDGTVVWQMSVMTGPQIMEGKHRVSMLHASIFDKYVYWRKAFKKVENVGTEEVNGKPCYKVIATPEGTYPETLFFDKESNLLVKTIVTIEHPMGKMVIESYPEDYKKSGGILTPFRARLKAMGIERTMTVTGIENNVQMPEDRFKLPAEIQALVDKKKEK